MKTVLQLDAAGYFVGQTLADESPLEPGVYLIPAGAVDAPPPDVPEGSRALWDGVNFFIEPIPVTPPQPTPIPTSVTMRQARLALLGAGLLSQVDAALASIADPVQRQAAQIDWEYAATVDRGSDLVVELASALNLDAAALDTLFTAAGAL